MSLENRDSSPFKPEEEFEMGLTEPLSRKDLLDLGAFSDIEGMPLF